MATEIILMVMCLMFVIFFSMCETAFISIPSIKISQLVEKKAPGARLVKKLKDEPNKLLSIILIGSNIASIGASVLGTSVILRLFESGNANTGVVLTIAAFILTFVTIVFGEIIPKTIAIKKTELLVLLFSWPIFAFSIILTPVALILTWISTPFIRLFGGKISEKGPFLTEEDLKFMIAASEKEGVIEREEREMISSIFEFGETIVSEVMTPRPDIKAIETSSSIDDVVGLIRETGHSRIPVYENNIDNIIGVVYAKELISSSRSDSLKDYLRSVIFVPEVKKIDELLHQMQSNRTHFAVIIDEYGITSGIVTMEDIIEEIVGEIHDEFEKSEKNIEKISENIYIIDGKVLTEEINRELGIFLPHEEGYETIAGLVFSILGKMPSVGNIVRIDDVEISVERVLKRRITRLKLMKLKGQLDDNIVGG